MWFAVCDYMLCRWTSINWTRDRYNNLNKGQKFFYRNLEIELTNIYNFKEVFFFYDTVEFLKFDIALFLLTY